MIKVIMNGCNGHMGHVISDLIFDDDDMEMETAAILSIQIFSTAKLMQML